jgi:hypothetical protein
MRRLVIGGYVPEPAAHPLIQNGSVALHPTPNRDVIHRKPSLRHHLLQITVAQRVAQIPPDTENDDHVFEMPPTEQRRSMFARRITLPNPIRGFTDCLGIINVSIRDSGRGGENALSVLDPDRSDELANWLLRSKVIAHAATDRL